MGLLDLPRDDDSQGGFDRTELQQRLRRLIPALDAESRQFCHDLIAALPSLPTQMQREAVRLFIRYPDTPLDQVLPLAWLLSEQYPRSNAFLRSLLQQARRFLNGELERDTILSATQFACLLKGYKSWTLTCETLRKLGALRRNPIPRNDSCPE